MTNISFILSFLVTLVWALPTTPAPRSLKGRSFIVKRIENLNSARVGSNVLRHAYEKYGWEIPPGLINGAGTPSNVTRQDDNDDDDDNGFRVAATSNFVPGETQFLVPVTVGGQALVLNLDTGSSDL